MSLPLTHQDVGVTNAPQALGRSQGRGMCGAVSTQPRQRSQKLEDIPMVPVLGPPRAALSSPVE